MGSGIAKGAKPDVLVINHDEPGSFDLTVNSSVRNSQTSLNSTARNKRRDKMMSAEPTNVNGMPDVENTSEKESEKTGKDAPSEEKKVVQKLTKEEILAKAEEIMPRLLNLNDYKTTDCAGDLAFLRKYSITYPSRFAEMGLTSVFERIWRTHMVDPFEDEAEKDLWNNMKCILIVMWNGTDRSEKLCQTVCDKKTYEMIIKWLKDPKLAPEMTSKTRESYAVKGLFGIIHNTLVHCDARHIFREAGIVQTLKSFFESPNLMVIIL